MRNRYTVRLEDITYMSKIGTDKDNNFSVSVHPSEGRVGSCYMKCYDGKSYPKATKLAMIDMYSPSYVYHSNPKNVINWELNSKDRKNLCKFLDTSSKTNPEAANWQMTLYRWNDEKELLDEEILDKYESEVVAFLDGFYDTEDNLRNPYYVASFLQRPDYTQLS